MAPKPNLLYNIPMSLKQIVNNFKRNFVTLEIGLFMWTYSLIIELTDNSPFFVFDVDNLFSNDFLMRNQAPIFWFAGLFSIIAAGSSFFSFKLFMTTLTLTTLAAFVRLESIFFFNTRPQPILFVLVWLHVIFMQMLLLARSSRKNTNKHLLDILRDDFDGI